MTLTPKHQLHVRIPLRLYRDLKVRAAMQGVQLQELVAQLLARGLKKEAS